MVDFAPRDGFPILAEAKLHAIIMGTGLIGSPKVIPASEPSEGGSSPGSSAPLEPRPHAGAAAACKIVTGLEGVRKR